MKFRLVEHPRYWWPMVVRLPDPDKPGEVIEQQLEVLLQARPQDELIADQRRINAMSDPVEQVIAEREALKEAIKGWRGVVGDDGADVTFSPDVLDRAMQHSWFRAGLSRALAESLSGQAARLGN